MRACHRTIHEWVFSDLGYIKNGVEVQEKAKHPQRWLALSWIWRSTYVGV